MNVLSPPQKKTGKKTRVLCFTKERYDGVDSRDKRLCAFTCPYVAMNITDEDCTINQKGGGGQSKLCTQHVEGWGEMFVVILYSTCSGKRRMNDCPNILDGVDGDTSFLVDVAGGNTTVCFHLRPFPR